MASAKRKQEEAVEGYRDDDQEEDDEQSESKRLKHNLDEHESPSAPSAPPQTHMGALAGHSAAAAAAAASALDALDCPSSRDLQPNMQWGTAIADTASDVGGAGATWI